MDALPLVISLLLLCPENNYNYEVMRTVSANEVQEFFYYPPRDRHVLRDVSPKNPNFDTTYFPTIKTLQKNATLVNEEKYPWLGKVVHSRTNVIPLMCTAACIEDRVFITAARSVATLKVAYTSIVYHTINLQAIAIVLPSRPTKQMFDDIALIVVDRSYKRPWDTIIPFPRQRNTDNYDWFQKWDLREGTAIGYVTEGDQYRLSKDQYLYELNITMGNDLCNSITGIKEGTNDYWVPCYHSCTVEQHKAKDSICKYYLSGEGHVIVEKQSNTVIGISTWAAYSQLTELPVGMAVPNSENFYEDYHCAMKIRDDRMTKIYKGYYSSLCNGNTDKTQTRHEDSTSVMTARY